MYVATVATNTIQRQATSKQLLANAAAILSLGAAAIHFGVAPSHFAEHPAFLAAFVVMGVLQIGWAMALRERPTRGVLLAGAALNAVIVILWLVTRTTGLPFGPDAGTPESVGVPDATATAFELIVVALSVSLLNGAMGARSLSSRAATAATLVLALAVAPLAGAALVAAGEEGPGAHRPASGEVAAGGGGHSAGQSAGRSSKSSTHAVKVLDNKFDSRRVEVEPGDTVEWTNEGASLHTVTADEGDFDSDELTPGDAFSHTFDKEGAYFYYCRLHGSPGKNGMWGVVIVATGNHKVAAHGGTPPAPTSKGPMAPGTRTVAISDDSFSPRELEVSLGDTVAWSNQGSSVHTVTVEAGEFDSGDLSAGSSFSHTFDEAGVYHYYCRYHGAPGSGMWGTITVTAANGSAPQAVGHVGGGGGAHQVAVPQSPSTRKVAVRDDSFSPQSLRVTTGDRVVWANEGGSPHTVTSETGKFDSGQLSPGQSYSFSFTKAGTYYYYCQIHGSPRSGMWGVVLVTGPGAKQAPPPGGGVPPGQPPAGGAAPNPQSEQVAARDDSFAPRSLSVPVGSTVQWINEGDSSHTVTSDAGKFNSGTLNPGGSFEFTFKQAGDYYYHCQFHGDPRQDMWGVVHVGAGGAVGRGGAGAGGAGGGGDGDDDDNGGHGHGGDDDDDDKDDDHSGHGHGGDDDDDNSGHGGD